MDPQAPTPTPVPPPPAPPVKNSLLVIMSLLLLIAVGLAGFFYFQTQKLTKQLVQYQSAAPSLSPAATPIVNAKCVEKSSLNCEEEVELSFECTEEYQNWARANCPGWEEKVDCTDPRPEVCTMECVETPPYICGSDGKSYCSVCQACSNKNVTWYKMKTSVCEEQ